MLAQSRSDGKVKELDVDLLQGQNSKPAEFDEIEEWLRAEKSESSGGGGGANPNDGEESLTSKEFDKFLAERAAVADSLPNISNRTSTNSDDARSKKKQEEPLLG